MEKQQALKLLALTDDESADVITRAFEAKLKLVDEKLSSAPTDALKHKLEQMKLALNKAHQVLTESQTPKAPTKPSPLSQTKMADLPGARPAHNSTESLEVGSVLSDRYEIKEFIAQGGMGAVYRAFDRNRDEDIAIKVMLPELLKNETAKERFLDEARLSSRLSHPNIVNVYDVIQDGELCFLTMELLQGQDLRELMNNRKIVRQNFTLKEVLEILEPICEALEHAHEITVHRDIKPENIFFTEDGKYKLMDFGIARLMSTSQRTQTGAATGTAYYMAPEQLKGAKNIDGRADQYALGVLAYELLSGEVPAGAIEPLNEIAIGINKKISAAVLKTLAPKPENRFDSLSGFLEGINHKDVNSPVKKLTLIFIFLAALVVLVSYTMSQFNLANTPSIAVNDLDLQSINKGNTKHTMVYFVMPKNTIVTFNSKNKQGVIRKRVLLIEIAFTHMEEYSELMTKNQFLILSDIENTLPVKLEKYENVNPKELEKFVKNTVLRIAQNTMERLENKEVIKSVMITKFVIQ